MTVTVFPASGQQQKSQSLITENFQEIKSFYDIPVTIQVEKTSLDEIFNQLEKQMRLRFLYNPKVIGSSEHRLSLNLTNVSVADVLTEVALQTGLTFRQVNGTISIGVDKLRTPGKEIFEVVQRTITGTVVDSQTGEALPGVNVIAQKPEDSLDSPTGTTTNMDGQYELEVPDDVTTLIFSYVGYQRYEVEIDGRSEINVELSQDVQMLEDVVVIGYGTVQKSDITGSVGSLRADQLGTGTQASVDQAIQGKIPGVQVTQNSAEPGGDFSIRIRGTNSITANNEPLYVIDGLPGSNPLNSMSPSDIESIEVLKDASATAIYGSRGSNGVILITTRQGQKETALEVTYDGSTSFQSTAKKLDVMNAQEYMSFHNSISESRREEPLYSQEEMNQIGDGTNWLDEVLRPAPVQEHQLSFSGGSSDTQYYLSMNYFDQEGIVINTNFQRYSGRVNLQHLINERVRVGLNLSNSLEQKQTVPLGIGFSSGAGVIATAIQLPPTMSVRNPDGSFTFSDQDLSNAVAQAETIHDNSEIKRQFGNAFTEFDMMDNLTLKLNLGFNQRSFQRDLHFEGEQTYRAQINEGQASKQLGEDKDYLLELTSEYDQDFDNHSIDVVGGYSYQKFIETGFDAQARNFPTSAFGVNNLGAGESVQNVVSSFKQENALLSGFGRINYNYGNRYLLTGTFRADGSSRFGENEKFGYFPSGALGWRVSNESFFPDNNFFSSISDLKLRVSYGLSGNQEIGNARSLVLLGTGPSAVFNDGDQVSIAPFQMANPDLRWETTAQLNLGLDFGLFEDRITGSIDYFESNTEDLLLELPIPATSGFTSTLQNVGDTKNSGLEFTIHSNNITGNFNWSTNFNFSLLNNEVTNLGELPNIIQGSTEESRIRFIQDFIIMKVGEPIGAYYGFEVEGIFQTQQEVDNFPSQEGAVPGSLRFKDINGDGHISQEDRTIIGDPHPKFTFGFNNNFNFKGFALDLFVEGRFGYEMANFTKIDSETPIDFYRNRESYVLNRWTQQNPISENPSFENPSLSYAFNSRIVRDASFIRLKNVRLSYTFPNLNLLGFSSLTIYATGQNLLTITDYDGFNPDVSSMGTSHFKIDYNAYPLARTYTLGINFRI